ncbi:hypothetical protein F511_36081 [Dorcoceras hygrometricum]|uniref:Uncharacterized protein n=1 Tax=Dorcoceras hygrometricum TaxID=472368 RepID=A0A2Z7D7K3_9LAMI|nr:hypothetical protein F511_36081 [Dorcoceras hygrometricum]
MFLVDWAVKTRIRPPEFETSIYDAKYHVSLCAPPLPSPKAAAAAAARLRRKIVSGHFDEENPFVLISSVLLVQADEGVSFLVVDRIGDIYRNLPRRADVIVTTVGARHKCQQELENRNFDSAAGPLPCAAAPLSQAHERARWRDCRAMAARDVRPVVAALARCCVVVAARWCAGFAPLPCMSMGETLRAGRALAARRRFPRRAQGAPLVSPLCAAAGRPWRAVAACFPADVERGCVQFVARPCARVRPCGARDFFGGGAATPASLRRCRDDWSDLF